MLGDGGEGEGSGAGRRLRQHQRAAECSKARVGSDQLDRLACIRACRVCARFQQWGGDADTRDGAHLGEQAFGHAVGISCEQLQAGVADYAVGELGDRAREALTCHLGGEQQRHTGGDTDDREELLDQT